MTPGTGSLPCHADPPSYSGVGPFWCPSLPLFPPRFGGPRAPPLETPSSSRRRSKPSRQFSVSSVPGQRSRAGFCPAVSPRPGVAKGRGWGVPCSRRELRPVGAERGWRPPGGAGPGESNGCGKSLPAPLTRVMLLCAWLAGWLMVITCGVGRTLRGRSRSAGTRR